MTIERRRRWAAKSILAIVATVITVAAASGCGGDGRRDGGDARTSVHQEGHGFLSATSANGGSSVKAPTVVPYTASFGDYVLCNRQDAEPITIDRVRFIDGEVPPLKAAAFVRVVTSQEVAAGVKSPSSYAPFISTLGSPPDFREPYSHYPVAGAFRSAAGSTVVEPCAEARLAAGEAASGTDFRGTFRNLVVTMEAGREGGDIIGFYIDYTVGDDSATLRVDWRMIACGSGIREEHACM